MNKHLLLLLTVALIFTSPANTQPLDGVGRLITSGSKVASCIFPVKVFRIDGKRVNEEIKLFTLNAGEHVIEAKPMIDLGLCVKIKRSASRAKIEPITINVETGKDYYLGLDANATRRKDWQLVVWRVKGDLFEGPH